MDSGSSIGTHSHHRLVVNMDVTSGTGFWGSPAAAITEPRRSNLVKGEYQHNLSQMSTRFLDLLLVVVVFPRLSASSDDILQRVRNTTKTHARLRFLISLVSSQLNYNLMFILSAHRAYALLIVFSFL